MVLSQIIAQSSPGLEGFLARVAREVISFQMLSSICLFISLFIPSFPQDLHLWSGRPLKFFVCVFYIIESHLSSSSCKFPEEWLVRETALLLGRCWRFLHWSYFGTTDDSPHQAFKLKFFSNCGEKIQIFLTNICLSQVEEVNNRRKIIQLHSPHVYQWVWVLVSFE